MMPMVHFALVSRSIWISLLISNFVSYESAVESLAFALLVSLFSDLPGGTEEQVFMTYYLSINSTFQ
jgi:hypothetical protein